MPNPPVRKTRAALDVAALDTLSGTNMQRSYMWQIALPAIGGEVVPYVEALCRKVDFGGGFSMEVNSTKEGAFTTHASGPVAVSQVSMSFLCAEPDYVLSYFRAWMGKMVDGRSVYQTKSRYASDVTVYQITTDGAYASGATKLVQAFPMGLGRSVLDFDGERLNTWSVKFSVDRVLFS